MTISDVMMQEFLHESEITKKLLDRVPEDKLDWKPHEKSMSLGRLATHVAEIPEWTDVIVNNDFFDMAASDYKPTVCKNRTELLEVFEDRVRKFKQVMEGKDDASLMENWQLRQGEHVALELPKAACLRSFILSHIIHHRGQLSVYLRENDVPLPGIYGPSADEKG
jgi:uncharacterized damage-inducible protein DinB